MDKDKIDKKDHILDVAERVFSEMGYDGASTRMISGEAGVNMAMLNYYFGSKEGLFLAVFNRKISSFKEILQDLNSNEELSTWQKVEKYIDLYAERVVSNNCFQKMLYQEMSKTKHTELTDQLTGIVMINVIELKKILAEGIEKGEIKKDTDIELVIATIYGTKNFIINTPHMTSSLLGYDIQVEQNLEEKFKPRIKSYLKTLLKAYLLHEHEHTN